MAYVIEEVGVWAGEIEDRPGGVAEKLAALSEAGADLEFVIARRAPEKPGAGVVFVAPIEGEDQQAAATKAGLKKATTLCSLRLKGPDKMGLGAMITKTLAEEGISLRGLSAAALGTDCVVYFAFDTEADADKAKRVLEEALQPE